MSGYNCAVHEPILMILTEMSQRNLAVKRALFSYVS